MRTVLALALIASLAACKPVDSQTVTGSTLPDDYRVTHPISIEEAVDTMDVPVGMNSQHLTAGMRANVQGFGLKFLNSRSAVIAIVVPRGSANARVAGWLANEIQDVLVGAGVNAKSIEIRSYRANKAEASAPIRIAYARICSGKLERGMKARLARTGKQLGLTAPQFFFASQRQLADTAFAGDVVGIPNHGTLRIGDTLTEGESLVFQGVPNFSPEILRRVRLEDAMKAKKLKEALQQMAEEGVVQLFQPEDGSPAIVGVVGALQLDVLKERLMAEYGLPVSFEMSRFSVCRWVSSDQAAELDKFLTVKRGDIARDLDGDPVFLAQDGFSLRYEAERYPAIKMAAIKEYHAAKAA